MRLGAEHATGQRALELTFVIGGSAWPAEPTWTAFVRTAHALLGTPSSMAADSMEQAIREGAELSWDVDVAALRLRAPTTALPDSLEKEHSVLALHSIAEWQELMSNRERGFSGVEIPLTAEQEVRAQHRRVQGPGG